MIKEEQIRCSKKVHRISWWCSEIQEEEDPLMGPTKDDLLSLNSLVILVIWDFSDLIYSEILGSDFGITE